jgi:hypothetical protein
MQTLNFKLEAHLVACSEAEHDKPGGMGHDRDQGWYRSGLQHLSRDGLPQTAVSCACATGQDMQCTELFATICIQCVVMAQ